MQKSKLKRTGNSKDPKDLKTRSRKPTQIIKTPDTEFYETEPSKKMRLVERDSEEVVYVDVFQGFEVFLKSLKTFNACDTSNLRETEKKKVLEMIYTNFTSEVEKTVQNSTMIIFGQPGLGKTLLVHEIIGNLEKSGFSYVQKELGKAENKTGEIEFHSIYLNAMNYGNCFDFIDEFLAAIDRKERFFKKEERKKANSVVKVEIFLSQLSSILQKSKFVVLIDELETLSQNDKGNFHHLMQILNLRKSGFVNVCISNTLNLFSSLNGNSLYLNFEYLIFKPYSEENLLSILENRLSRENTKIPFEQILSEAALMFVVKKAFKNTSSDVRFILTVTQNILENKQLIVGKMQAEGKKLRKVDLKVSFPEILEVFNQKLCGDWAGIILKLNFPTQVLLLVIWQNVDEVNQTVGLVKLLEYFGGQFQKFEKFVWN